jgi:protein-disulfide isomerase
MKAPWRIDPYFLLGFVSVLLIGGSIARQRGPSPMGAPLPEVRADLFLTLDALGVGRLVGDPGAPVRIATLSDYACEGCAVAEANLRSRLDRWLDDGLVNLVVYETPIPVHPYSAAAAAVAGCAYQQGTAEYRAVREIMLTRRGEWLTSDAPMEALAGITVDAGASAEPLRVCLREIGDEFADRALRGWEVARAAGVTYVPVWFVNGRAVSWPRLDEEVRHALQR